MADILVCAIPYDNGKSGISNYINNVVEELSKNNKIDLIILKKDLDIFPVKNKNMNFIKVSNILKSPLLNMIWVTFILPFLIKYKKYDFVFLPAGNRRVFAFYKIKTIITFHDLSQFNIKGKYDLFRMFYIKKIIPFFLKKAPILTAISENTKKDMIKHYKIDGDKIYVNYNGYEENLFNKSLQPDIQKIKEEFGIEKKYFLYIARIEHPGKNHINLIKAYDMLPDKIKDEYDLVFAGGMWNGSEKVLDYIKEHEVKNVRFLGFISNEILPVLFKTASLYTFPSLYEGFGILLSIKRRSYKKFL